MVGTDVGAVGVVLPNTIVLAALVELAAPVASKT